jgi:hypothetical protein
MSKLEQYSLLTPLRSAQKQYSESQRANQVLMVQQRVVTQSIVKKWLFADQFNPAKDPKPQSA